MKGNAGADAPAALAFGLSRFQSARKSRDLNIHAFGMSRKIVYSPPIVTSLIAMDWASVIRELRILLTELPASRFYTLCAVFVTALLVYMVS